MARIVKALSAFVAWRWMPCIALVASSLLFVLIAVAVVPANISLGPKSPSLDTGETVNVISDAPQRSERPQTTPLRRPTTTPTPVTPPPPPPAPIAPPVEERRAEPPPPPPPPAPAPAPAREEDEQNETPPAPAPAPGPPSSRFMATPLRFLNQAVNHPGGGAGAPTGEPAPAPAPNNPDEER